MISEIVFSPNGEWIVMGGLDGIISMWDLSSLNLFEMDHLDHIIHSTGMKIIKLQFDSKGRYVIFSDLKQVLLCPVDITNTFNKKIHTPDK